MNAHSPVVAPPDDHHLKQLDLVQQWRGQCMQHFAKLELLIEGLLIDLKRAPKGGRKVKTGQPIGPAFAHLRDLVATNGPFGPVGQALGKRLGQLSGAMEWRAHLTHGELKLWRGQKGDWLLTFAHRLPGDEVVRLHAITWKQALELQALLDKQIPALASNCGSLKAALAA